MADNQSCSVHEEMLKIHGEDIKEIKQQIYGLPQKFDSLEKNVTTLCVNVSDLIKKLEDKYQTKEVCEMCSKGLQSRIENIEEKEIAPLKEEIKGLKEENSKLKWGLIVILATVLGELILPNLPKLFK
jgi:predicted transcriptional regulator